MKCCAVSCWEETKNYIKASSDFPLFDLSQFVWYVANGI